MKIICVGRNYKAHAKELQNDVPTSPVIFLKPDTAVLETGKPFYYPNFSTDINYELEIILRISKQGKNIAEKFASRYYDKVSVGIDFTARDLQEQLKQKGLPWERAKAFDNSAVLGTWVSMEDLAIPVQELKFHLTKNKQIVQQGDANDMIFTINYLIAEVSNFITLRPGDVIFTGTPAGVGPIKIGDELVGYISDKQLLQLQIK